MHIKSLADLKAVSSGDDATSSVIDKIAKSINQRAQQRTYRNLAAAILQRRNIHPDTKELAPILGNYSGATNLVAVAEWIEREDPILDAFGEVDIQEYSSQLWSLYEEYVDC